ncbi:MnhB domain-containing protein [Halocatena marina]|uniref:MnhB domain-containing protein n=1 Tax=Halocatena marina TaxID=2934937 RepID=UPI0036072728
MKAHDYSADHYRSDRRPNRCSDHPPDRHCTGSPRTQPPGGGFIGGVLTATAFALVYISYGSEYLVQALLSGAEGAEGTGAETESIQAESRFLSGAIGTYTRMFAFGLALAAGSGVVAVVLGVPFLTQAVALVHHVPIYKELEFASALAFDLGVYFVVVGSLLTILAVVGDE